MRELPVAVCAKRRVAEVRRTSAETQMRTGFFIEEKKNKRNMIIVSHSYTDGTHILVIAWSDLNPNYMPFVLVHTLMDNLSWLHMD
jgi:hypothetical protein